MKLDVEIKQNTFINENHKLLINIIYTGSWIQGKIAADLKPYDITPQQFNVLRILRGQHPKPARIQLLQERMLDSMSNASRLVERLRKKELVIRRICKNDRRAVDVTITELGINLLKQLDEIERNWLTMFESINPEEAKYLNTSLDKLRN